MNNILKLKIVILMLLWNYKIEIETKEATLSNKKPLSTPSKS